MFKKKIENKINNVYFWIIDFLKKIFKIVFKKLLVEENFDNKFFYKIKLIVMIVILHKHFIN